MKHQPFLRTNPNARAGVLLVHGILSTPRHFDFLLSKIPESYNVNCLLLAGHGEKVKDFSRATAKQWRAQVEEALTEMEQSCERVYIIGYSLGCLLSLELLQSHPNVAGVILLNPPLLPQLKFSMAWRSVRFVFGRVHRNDPADMLCFNDLGIELEPYIWKYIGWIPNFISLLTMAKKCQKLPREIKMPCFAFLGLCDEVVRPKTARYLKDNPNITTEIFEKGVHFGYSEEEQTQIFAAMETLFGKED